MFSSCVTIPSFEKPIDSIPCRKDKSLFQVGKAQFSNGSATEDIVTVKPQILNESVSDYFALFEGHRNGYTASRSASMLLHEYLRNELKDAEPCEDMRQSFENAYLKTDNHLKAVSVDRGTSAVALLLRKHDDTIRLHFSNVGCSRAILCRGNTALCLTQDHTISNPDEKSRLEQCNAHMQTSNRIRQLIPSTCAIGDHLLKSWVTSRPHYAEYDLTQQDSFIVCMTRNMSGVISDDEVLALSAACSAQDLSDRLVSEAVARGARGSLAALCVRLDWDALGGGSDSGSLKQGGRRSLRNLKHSSSWSGSAMTRRISHLWSSSRRHGSLR